METTVLSTLVVVAFALLVLVSGGVVYLTVVDWRDRRRREQDTRETKGSRSSSSAKK